MLVMVTPGGFNQFFEELSSLNRGLSAPDLARTEELMNFLRVGTARAAAVLKRSSTFWPDRGG
jgi:hypothetical protein